MASTFDQAMTHVMRWHADWSGAETTAITFAVNKDFFEARLTAPEAQALVGTWQAGGISFETLFWNLQAGEWIAPGRTIEQERALIAAGEDHPGQTECQVRRPRASRSEPAARQRTAAKVRFDALFVASSRAAVGARAAWVSMLGPIAWVVASIDRDRVSRGPTRHAGGQSHLGGA